MDYQLSHHSDNGDSSLNLYSTTNWIDQSASETCGKCIDDCQLGGQIREWLSGTECGYQRLEIILARNIHNTGVLVNR